MIFFDAPHSCYVLRPSPPPPQSPAIGKAIELLCANKISTGRRERYVKELGRYLRQWARGNESRPISSVTTEDVEAWFAGRKESPATKASNLGRLAALFTFARKRGWISVSPLDPIDRIRFEPRPPKILSPQEAKMLLDVCAVNDISLLPYLTLGIFAGIRPEEIRKMTWANIDLASSRAIVDAAASKVRMRRIVPLEAACVAWLEACDHSLPLCPHQIRRRRRRIARAAGLKWSQDVLRHTAASYLVALHQDAPRVAMALGNSPSVLFRHYRELVGVADCSAFWSIRPVEPIEFLAAA